MFKIDDCLSLTEETVQGAVYALNVWYDVVLTPEECVRIIRANKILAAELYLHGCTSPSTRVMLITGYNAFFGAVAETNP